MQTSLARRRFLQDCGRFVLCAGVGPALASELHLMPACAAEETPRRLSFGKRDALVDLLEQTPLDRLLPTVVAKLGQGVSLADLTAAAALCNARKFGGQDYIGYHTFMALAPALTMAHHLPEPRRPLPILKVLYRNSSRIHETGGADAEALHAIEAGPQSTPLRDAVHQKNIQVAEQALARSVAKSPLAGYEDLLDTVEENADVHRVVLANRVWDMLELVGMEHAETMLRQSVRYCIDQENWRVQRPTHSATLLPKLLDEYRLLSKPLGERVADDAWIESMQKTLFASTAEQAADAVAAALAEGFSLASVFEAISLSSNQLVLRDAGRSAREVRPNKPEGSVHGDSIGVHACDSTHAWRNIASVSAGRHAACAAILAGYQSAFDRVQRGGDFLNWQPRPPADVLARVTTQDPDALLQQLDRAIQENNQEAACALTQRYGDLGHEPVALQSVLLKYAISEDGALHAEKYFRTATDEFAATRPRFRWRQLVALARVSASQFGNSAPGLADAQRLLGLS